jgi:AcrR family transcriptional regulator
MLTMSTLWLPMLTMSTIMCDDAVMPGKQTTRTSYHHGNLRPELIQAGLRLIEKKGVRALTLREIGAQLGVSRMAAYRHFKDKADLLGAIREAGFTEFANALDEARSKGEKSCAKRLAAMAHAYVRFAAEHPAYFEVMFAWNAESSEERAPSPSGARAFWILEETIRDGQKAGEFRSGDPVQLARIIWAQVHGISMLGLAPLLSSGGPAVRFIDFSSEVLLTGLARKRRA